MSAARLLNYLHLAYLAKPVADRAVFRTIHKSQAGNLVIIGLGNGQLAGRMLALAQKCTQRPGVRLTVVDQFELRPATEQPLSIKQAYRLLHTPGARVQLVPGDPFMALARTANTLLDTDLLLIRADQQGAALEQAWFYVPRMLHPGSLVLLEQLNAKGQTNGYEVLDYQSVQQRFAACASLRRAA